MVITGYEKNENLKHEMCLGWPNHEYFPLVQYILQTSMQSDKIEALFNYGC